MQSLAGQKNMLDERETFNKLLCTAMHEFGYDRPVAFLEESKLNANNRNGFLLLAWLC